jgi:hypothetical protein
VLRIAAWSRALLATRWARVALAALALLGLARIGMAVMAMHGPIDDAFITAHYAQNLADGHGWVWNVGAAPTYGTTAPLWTMILAAALRLGAPLIPTMQRLDVLGYAITGVAGCAIAARIAGIWGATISLATAAGFAALLSRCVGMETTLYTSILLCSMLLWHGARPRGALLLAGLLPLVRGEGILLLAVLCLVALCERRLRPLVPALGLALLPALCWEAFSWWQFHALLPTSYLAKQAVGARVGPTITPSWFLAVGWSHVGSLWLWCGAALGALAGARCSVVRVMALWLLAYVTFYSFVAGVAVQVWYIVPAWFVLPPLLGIGVGLSIRRAAGMDRAGLVAAGLAAACAVLGLLPAPAVLNDALTVPWGGPGMYGAAASFLASQPKGLVAAAEIGVIGYYSGDPVVDIQGLVNPEVVPHLARRDYTWLIRHDQPRYVFIWAIHRDGGCYPDYVCAIWHTPWFVQHYHVVWRTPWDANGDYVIAAYGGTQRRA